MTLFLSQDNLGYKMFVQKLTAFAKFDLDTKIGKFHFFHLFEQMASEQIPAEGDEEAAPQQQFNEELYAKLQEAWT